jgi:hypothetical protein
MKSFNEWLNEAKFIDALATHFDGDKQVGKVASYFNIPDEHVDEMKRHLKKIEELQKALTQIDPTGGYRLTQKDKWRQDIRRQLGTTGADGEVAAGDEEKKKIDALAKELQQAFRDYNQFRTSIGATGRTHGHIDGDDAKDLNWKDFI